MGEENNSISTEREKVLIKKKLDIHTKEG